MSAQGFFTEGKLLVRQLEERDVGYMAKWLSDPRVLEFYEGRDHPFSLQMVREKFLPRTGDPVTACIVEYEGEPIGYIQFCLWDPEEKAQQGYPVAETIYGIDLFIGVPELWNHGIGTQLVTAMARYLTSSKGADRVTLDPWVENKRAIRCYEKSGFRKVKLLPQHEPHEGELVDCWLMEFSLTS